MSNDYETSSDRQRWRLMEQFENIAEAGPVFAGDLISKTDAKRLIDGGLVTKNDEGSYIVTNMGFHLWCAWSKVV